MSDFLKSLASIQMELKAPKGQYNSFGKYTYRSCEDILEAVKPLLAKHGLTLMLTDKPVAVGSRIYIEATAWLRGDSSGDDVEVTAYAREPDDKKGMDASQITGTASSYARKYALNGLFLIDDTKDADTDEYKTQTSVKAQTSSKAQASSKVQTSSKAQASTEGTVEPVICPKCGKRIADYPKPDGTIVPAQTVYDSCGHMCFDCYKKSKSKEITQEDKK